MEMVLPLITMFGLVGTVIAFALILKILSF